MSFALAGPLAAPPALAAPAVAAAPGLLARFSAWLNQPLVKALTPVPIVIVVGAAMWWVFRGFWREIDREAHEARAERFARGETDYRPFVLFATAAIVLTMQDYYGGRSTYDEAIRPWLQMQETVRHHAFLKMAKYDELYAYVWWVSARVVGYVLIPFPVYKLCFPKDSLLDMGLRVGGFVKHLWIYVGLLLVVCVPLFVVARHPDFGGYYPFYKNSQRSVFDLLAWEALYYLQFFALELFFRGLWMGATRRSLGSVGIFTMCVPYVMIHYGKPYLEANGALIAGAVLGTLAMRTRSIYGGFLVHIAVAGIMDVMALYNRHQLPHTFWAPG